MDILAHFLLAIGVILLLGLFVDFLGRKTLFPRVTVLLVLGILLGNQGIALIPESVNTRFEIVADMTLLMVGFLVGGKLDFGDGKLPIRQLLLVSILESLGTCLVVFALLWLAGVDWSLALILGGIASASAPAATLDNILETRASGPFVDNLLGVVAIDDVWALFVFSLCLAAVTFGMGDTLQGEQFFASGGPLLQAVWEVFGAVLLGTVIGLPAAFLTGRLKPGEPMLSEALGLVFICGGCALWLEVSFLIASIVMGAVIANLARHHEYAFHEIENIEWPLMVVFFVLAGATLELDALASMGLAGVVYILARCAGKYGGAWLGACLAGSEEAIRRWLGLALLPQAGVAIGMALVAATRFPQFSDALLSIVVATTIVFELCGPVLQRYALRKAAGHAS